jgi:hypothetical protein
LRNFGVHDWMMPSCREATGSVIGEESLMMVLPVKQEEPELMQIAPVISAPTKKRKRGQLNNSVTRPRVPQQIWTVPLSQPVQAQQQQMMQPHVMLSQPVHPLQLSSVVQTHPVPYVCNSVTGDTEEPPVQHRCVGDALSPNTPGTQDIKSENDQSVNTVVSDNLISKMLDSAVGETELDSAIRVRLTATAAAASAFASDDAFDSNATAATRAFVADSATATDAVADNAVCLQQCDWRQ